MPDVKKTVAAAVKELRTALGETQEQFAVRMKTVVRTISRWEGNRPPRGDVLRALARLAEKANRPDLATIFEKAHVAEISLDPFIHRGMSKFVNAADGSQWGVIVQWLDSGEIAFGRQFQKAIHGLHCEHAEQYRRALQDFANTVDKIEGEK